MSNFIRFLTEVSNENKLAESISENAVLNAKETFMATSNLSENVSKELTSLLTHDNETAKIGSYSLNSFIDQVTRSKSLNFFATDMKHLSLESTKALEDEVAKIVDQSSRLSVEAEYLKSISFLHDVNPETISELQKVSGLNVEDVLIKLESQDEKFFKFMKNLKDGFESLKLKNFQFGFKVIIAGVVGISLYEWISNYINENNGPRLIVESPLKKNFRIKAPYPCGFKNKEGNISHPLHNDIQNLLRRKNEKTCDNFQQYDNCGGWTKITPKSRLASISSTIEFKTIVSKINKGSRLLCVEITIFEALAVAAKSLAEEAGNVAVSAAEGLAKSLGLFPIITHFLSFFISAAVSVFVHKIFRNQLEKHMLIFVAFFTFFVLYFLVLTTIKRFVKNLNKNV